MSTNTCTQVQYLDLTEHIDACIQVQQARQLSERSIHELQIQLTKLNVFSEEKQITSFSQYTASLLKDFILSINPCASVAQTKAIVWCLRTFFSYLTVIGKMSQNPAAVLSHPKISPRHKLPNYLSSTQLRTLMQYIAEHESLKDFTIFSLLATTGARPKEICTLRLKDLHLDKQFIFLCVKGNWYKQTFLSDSMNELLQEYIDTIEHNSQYVFLNSWNKQIDTRYIQRLIRRAITETKLPVKKVTPNTIRHTFATYAADRHGKTITKALLGHCPQSHSTDVYMHLSPSKFRHLMNTHPYQIVIARGRND